MPDLPDLATPGATIAVRVTPGAARNAIIRENGAIRIAVTAAPEIGKANAAATRLLASALGVAKSRLSPIHVATSRRKVFRIDQPRHSSRQKYAGGFGGLAPQPPRRAIGAAQTAKGRFPA